MPKKNPKFGTITRGAQLYWEDENDFVSQLKLTRVKPSELLRDIVKNYFAKERLKQAGYDMTNSAVIKAQMKVVESLKTQLDTTANNMKEITERMEELTKIVNQRTITIGTQIEQNSEISALVVAEIKKINHDGNGQTLISIQKQITTLTQIVEKANKFISIILKNLITLRGIIYLYLVGFRFGALNLKGFTGKLYIKLVLDTASFMYKKSDDEIMALSNGEFDRFSQQVADHLGQEMSRISKITNETKNEVNS